MLIRKFPTTEKIRQIYFLQLLAYEDFRGVVVDLDSINIAFPGFLQTHDFTGIAVDNLFQYIVFETRAGTNSIYYMNHNFDYFPDVLYGFCEDDFNQETTNAADFPLLFDSIDVSVLNNLVAMYQLGSLHMFNKDGDFLGYKEHPNLYDRGHVSAEFIDAQLLVVVNYDENNGSSYTFFTNTHDGLKTCLINSIKQLKLMMDRGVCWEVDHLTTELRNNRKAVLLTLQNLSINSCPIDLMHISNRLKKSESFALEVIKICPNNFSNLDPSIVERKEFVLKAISINPEVIDYVPHQFRQDLEIVSLAAENYPLAYVYLPEAAPPDLFLSKKNILHLASWNPQAIYILSEEFKNDPQIVRIALKQDPSCAIHLSALHHDRAFALSMVSAISNLIPYLTAFKNDVSFALECVSISGSNLQYFPEHICNNKEVFLRAIEENKYAVVYAGDELKQDPEIAKLVEEELSNMEDLPF